jgi:hypothetical protein
MVKISVLPASSSAGAMAAQAACGLPFDRNRQAVESIIVLE